MFGMYEYSAKANEELEGINYWFCDVAEIVSCEINVYIEISKGDYSKVRP